MTTPKQRTADGLQIWCVELDKVRAEEIAHTARNQGRKARVAKRLVKAFGITELGYVVLVGDKPAAGAAK